MPSDQLARLERIEVDGLFGIYKYCISLNLNDRVTILHGPNGVGKTTVLRMVDALLRQNFGYFARFPIRKLQLAFQNQTTLELSNIAPNSETKELSATLTLKTPDATNSDEIGLSPSLAETIAEKVEYLKPYASTENTWIDLRYDEVLTEAEVISRYGESGYIRRGKSLPWFDAFLKNANTRFIEAQRLVRTSLDSIRWRRHPSPASRVIECSRDLKRRMAATMEEYGREAQILDQSFPQRLISATNQLPVTDLQQRMSELDRKIKDYKHIGILDITPDRPFHVDDQMDDTQARVMTLYANDTEKKLRSLADLATRSKLLLDSLNGKFRHKQIRLDRSKGLIVVNDEEQPLPLEWLSSGEQHELVLHYDLLFKVQPNTVVLIDEPELSLHVEWQERFLIDLLKIIELSSFDAVIATHSPYIVGEKDKLMVALGDAA